MDQRCFIAAKDAKKLGSPSDALTRGVATVDRDGRAVDQLRGR
ncbi:MAG: hypothetical protein QOG92_356 [Verrucomicrobiota bacterium]|jgi:hypothetical protein|nr:hypothetical protein [Verrucomicrobiota bacterium]